MRLFFPGNKLRERVVHAGFWSFVLHCTGIFFGFVRTLIIARLLSPNDIGLFALAALIFASIDTFSRTGFQSALIHREGDIHDDLDVAWTVHVVRGFIRAGFLFLIAPAAAHFFNEAAVKSLVHIVALAMICQGFINSGVIYLKKELEFHKHFLFALSRRLTDMVVSITAAVCLQNAWALVYGLVAGYLIQVIVSYKVHPFRPRFCFNSLVFRRLTRYGIWMNFTGIMVFAGTYGASIVVGKVISAHALGFYQMAHWITQSALVEVASVLGMVAFSAYAKMQQDQARMRKAYLMMAGFTFSVAFPVAVMITLTGDVFVRIFLGDRWIEMIQPLRLLAVAGCFHAIALSGRPVFLGIGQPRSLFLMQTVRTVTMLVIIFPFTFMGGITGAAGAMVISNMAALLFWHSQIRASLQLTLKDLGQLFGPPLIAATTMSVGVILLLFFSRQLYGRVPGAIEVLWFIGLLTACFIIYVLTLRLIQPFFPRNQPEKAFGIFFHG
ncbi:oligosaccharide flippase family protein [Acidobacteriota bacterium]